MPTRHQFNQAIAALCAPPSQSLAASGPFTPDWPSLVADYRAPDWFADAKFGIWAHWTAQCVLERGDWYARRMYLQGDCDYDDHLSRYGHPADSGFMEIEISEMPNAGIPKA